MKAYTDYPFVELGDISGEIAPIREIEVISYDFDKYCKIRVNGIDSEIKLGYIYQQPGRVGEVLTLTKQQVYSLPKTVYD